MVSQEKINKMNVQNVSLVLSPTMQISHRVLNAFFLYGKILFSGVAIKRYGVGVVTWPGGAWSSAV